MVVNLIVCVDQKPGTLSQSQALCHWSLWLMRLARVDPYVVQVVSYLQMLMTPALDA